MAWLLMLIELLHSYFSVELIFHDIRMTGPVSACSVCLGKGPVAQWLQHSSSNSKVQG
jgi:hypothetical protein